MEKRERKSYMKKTLFLLPVSLLALTACKPTPTFPQKKATDETVLVQVPLTQNETVAVEEKALPVPSPDASLLRINTTRQGYNHQLPWKKNTPEDQDGLGVLLEGDVILTTAEMVADAAFISFADPSDSVSFPAELVAVDYEANLALLRPQKEADRAILKQMIPLTISGPLPLSTQVEMWQLGAEGLPLITEGKLQNYEMSDTLVPYRPFLTYRVKAPMQSEQNSFTLPVVNDGKLAGILTSYNSSDQISNVVDSSVIKAFVEDAMEGEYKGFPGLGISVTETTDPTFRRYLKLTDDMGGIYVNKLDKKGCGARGGLQKGDVILSVDGHKIYSRGSYESPEYGKLSWMRLINGDRKVGDVTKLEISRDGKLIPLEIVLECKKASSLIVPPYMYGKAPNYIVHGGLVFSELSVPYLQSFRNDWSSARASLVSAAKNASDYEEKGLRRIVVLNGSIPSVATLGYESIPSAIVESVDGKPVKDLNDLALALDDKTQDIKTIGLSQAPYKIYLSDKAVQAANEMLKKRITPQLRRLEQEPIVPASSTPAVPVAAPQE